MQDADRPQAKHSLNLMCRLNAETEHLVVALRTIGPCKEIVDELMLSLVQLARAKSKKFSMSPWIQDELYSAALVELYGGIKKAAAVLLDTNLVYYLAARLNRNLPKICYRLLNPAQSWDSAHAKDGRKNWSLVRHDLMDDAHCILFTEREDKLYETILSLCENDRETTTIQMLREYYTCTEIGEVLGVSKQTISTIRVSLRERYANYVREETSHAVRDNCDAILRKDKPSDGSGSVHASGETGSTAESIMAQY